MIGALLHVTTKANDVFEGYLAGVDEELLTVTLLHVRNLTRYPGAGRFGEMPMRVFSGAELDCIEVVEDTRNLSQQPPPLGRRPHGVAGLSQYVRAPLEIRAQVYAGPGITMSLKACGGGGGNGHVGSGLRVPKGGKVFTSNTTTSINWLYSAAGVTMSVMACADGSGRGKSASHGPRSVQAKMSVASSGSIQAALHVKPKNVSRPRPNNRSRSRPRPNSRLSSDYDFESANDAFTKLQEQMSNLAVCDKTMEGAESVNLEPTAVVNDDVAATTGDEVSPYDSKESFFDNLSFGSNRRPLSNFAEEQQRNYQTFGRHAVNQNRRQNQKVPEIKPPNNSWYPMQKNNRGFRSEAVQVGDGRINRFGKPRSNRNSERCFYNSNMNKNEYGMNVKLKKNQNGTKAKENKAGQENHSNKMQ